jgi:hypothetical protein
MQSQQNQRRREVITCFARSMRPVVVVAACGAASDSMTIEVRQFRAQEIPSGNILFESSV